MKNLVLQNKRLVVGQAMLQAVCIRFNNKMYRLCPDVSTGFRGLDYVSHLEFGAKEHNAHAIRNTCFGTLPSLLGGSSSP